MNATTLLYAIIGLLLGVIVGIIGSDSHVFLNNNPRSAVALLLTVIFALLLTVLTYDIGKRSK